MPQRPSLIKRTTAAILDFSIKGLGFRDWGFRHVGVGAYHVGSGIGETVKARISCPRLQTTGAIEHWQLLQLT